MSNKVPSKIEQRFSHMKAVVQQAGVKLTHQRLEIFREIATSEEHPDVDTIFRSVQKRVPTVSVDTVYRTLWMLHDLDLVVTLGPERDRVRFDANRDPHHHYVCTRCGLVRDFESADLNALHVPAAVKKLGSIAAAHVEVRGVCTSCQAEQTDKTSPKQQTKQPEGKTRHD